MRLITETKRLKLIKVTAADVDLVYLLTGNKNVMEFFPKVLSYDENQQMVEKILHQYTEYGYCFWKILLKPGEQFVGIAGLLHQEINGEVETEISYRMLPVYWNNGYATEAAKACKEYGENTLGKRRLISLIHPRNHASIRVAQKLCAKKTKSVFFIGEEHGVYVYPIE